MKRTDSVWRWLLGAGGWDGQVRRYWHHCSKIRQPWADQLSASVLAPLAVFISGRLLLSSSVPHISERKYKNWFPTPIQYQHNLESTNTMSMITKSLLSCGKIYFHFLCTYRFHHYDFCLLLSKHSLSEISRNLTLRASGTGKVFLNDQDLTSMAQVFQDCKLGCSILQYNNHQMMSRGWKSRFLSTQATFWLLGLTIWNQGLAERLTVIIIIIPIIGIIRENWKKGC